MNKKLICLALSVMSVVLLTSLSGCKKGDNDPFISFRSRMKRITGEWKLQEGMITTVSNFGGNPATSTQSYTETTCATNGTSVPYSETLTIEKDGTYSINVTEDGDSYTITGVWFFTDKVKDLDLKKKEAIVLVEQVTNEFGFTSSIDGLIFGEPLIIDQLKNEEIIFKGETNYDTGSGNFGSTTTYEKRFQKQ